MDNNLIKEFEDLGKRYFAVWAHKKLRATVPTRYTNIINLFDKNANIVDVGCGGNQFKSIFPNLIAFDMVDYGDQDFVCSILEAPIEEGTQDAVFCFGVLHECPDEYHLPNIVKMLSWLKPDGQLIMKSKKTKVINKHPDIKNRRKVVQKYEKYLAQGLWTEKRIYQFTNDLNLKINFLKPLVVSRKQQWEEGKSIFDSKYDNDIMFDGYIWSWSKNA